MAVMALDVVDASALSYAAFCDSYMARNRPVLIRNVVDAWFPRARQWVARSADGRDVIDFAFLQEAYGQLDVPVVDGESEEYGAREYITMKFAEYLEMVRDGTAGKKYLKDWHFVKAADPSPPLYTTPIYFQDDWLNWWWDRKDTSGDDYRFVYIGPTGSSTPMHHDVFRSYSWSVNVVGRKEWIFFSPDEESMLKDKFGRTLIADVTDPSYDRNMYPHVSKATPLLVTQVSGDAIFVPSGWYHQVKNLENTISINHNWFNGFNIENIWAFLKSEYAAVENELVHLQEVGLVGEKFRAQCQVVMLANTGMNYVEFRSLLLAKKVDLEAIIESGDDHGSHEATSRHLKTILAIIEDINGQT